MRVHPVETCAPRLPALRAGRFDAHHIESRGIQCVELARLAGLEASTQTWNSRSLM
jgi:hypothetical protein